SYGAEYIPVPTDDEGFQPHALEAAFQSQPKFVYVMPNFQNPSGVTLNLARRQRLLDLAARYGVPIVEDDPYGQLRFEGEPLPSLLALDAQRRQAESAYHGLVIHLSTFSKTLAPGLRVAWVIAPPEVIRRLVQAKQGADLHSSTFAQIVAYEVARGGLLADHVPLIRQVYRERRDVMLQALADHFPPGVTWTRPAGGMFLWVTLPEGVDAAEVLRQAVKVKVAFVPGANFFPYGGGENTLRLNFSNATHDGIREGIARLGEVLRPTLDAKGQPAVAMGG
ncbi:MAG: PLP-dependent aminotransferase family protein, partial [Anaerolineae bacterium]|nr:PLP-dependent aminotransferase family protein [Anaerolineae bacterium]